MPDIYVLLENIRSAYNVGAMFRTADGAGVKKVFVCGITAKPPNTEISKTALGAEGFVDWEYEEESMDVIEKLRKNKGKNGKGEIEIVAVEIAKGAANYWDWKPKIKNGCRAVCLIFGHETEGVSREVLKAADTKIFIPMFGKKESLNVEAAFSTVVYETQRKFKHEN